MRLVKVHRVMRFTQSLFLAEYISHCTNKRAASKSEFRKRLFKDFANSCFGKFIEQTRTHLQCHIVSTQEKFEKWVSNPRYANFKVLAQDITAIFLRSGTIKMKQAWAIGFTILERSKGLVYNHFYNIIRPALPNCTILFTDTDSLCLSVRGMSMERILDSLSIILDFSNYDSDHPLHNTNRENKLGYWKDELKGRMRLLEFVGLASKTYAMRLAGPDGTERNDSKCKGVTKAYRKTIPFEEYKKCVMSKHDVTVTQHVIRSKDHTIRTLKMNRRCFSSFDDKRYILRCGIHSLPYGHHRIKMMAMSKANDICELCA